MLKADRIVHTTCPYCGVGCQVDLHIHTPPRNRGAGALSPRNRGAGALSPRNRGAGGAVIFRANGRYDNQVNFGNLCVKGRFGYDYVHAPDRLTTPLMRSRRDAALRPTTWEAALETVATRLAEIRDQHGPDSVAILTSAKCTNEENYLLQKLTRAVIGTNNVDHCARL